jgi:hypothetical protein
MPAITSQPTPKVIGATGGSGIGGAIGTPVAWPLDNYHVLSAQPLSTEVKSAIVTLVSAFFAFLGGYYMRPAPTQTVLQDDAGRNATAM